MKNVDIVIISDTKNDKLKDITKYCLDTLYSSEKNINFLTYIVESNLNVNYSNIHKNIIMVKPDPPFGYHKYLNLGRKIGKSNYVCLCNNDLEFHKNWATNIIKEMEKDPDLLSASPVSQIPHLGHFKINLNTGLHYGHKVRRHIAGWCIFQQRKIYDIIKNLDERFIFWYCDNDYSKELQHKKIKHALVTNSHVNHLVSKTLNTKKHVERNRLTKQQQKVFLEKWKK